MKPLTKNISKGVFGAEVLNLQRGLEKMGFGDFVPTGYFGDKTVASVIKFQKTYGLTVTGAVNEKFKTKFNQLLGHSKGSIFLSVAKTFIGTDASPLDRAPDELACAESVNNIHRVAFGQEIGGGLSTAQMYKVLTTYTDNFEEIQKPEAGAIIISPTGYGNGKVVGHVGICLDQTWVLSNSSSNGKFEKNYTVMGWKNHYGLKGNLPIKYFRLK